MAVHWSFDVPPWSWYPQQDLQQPMAVPAAAKHFIYRERASLFIKEHVAVHWSFDLPPWSWYPQQDLPQTMAVPAATKHVGHRNTQKKFTEQINLKVSKHI